MKIAVPYDNGQVVLHLKDAVQFKIYDTLDDEILSQEILPFALPSSPASPGAAKSPADFLISQGVHVLICGLLPISALMTLQNSRIQVLGGASGDADERVKDFLGGTLHFDRGGGCASCSASCSLRAAGSGLSADKAGAEEPECDGNISACGHWCH